MQSKFDCIFYVVGDHKISVGDGVLDIPKINNFAIGISLSTDVKFVQILRSRVVGDVDPLQRISVLMINKKI